MPSAACDSRVPLGPRRVSRTRPCPVCGGVSECYFLPDGLAVVCTRVESPRHVYDAIKTVAYVHPLPAAGTPAVQSTAATNGAADVRWREAMAARWLRPTTLRRGEREAADAALDAYLRGRGFLDGRDTLRRAGLTPTVHLRVPWGRGAADEGAYYYAWPVATPTGAPAAAVLALTPDGSKAQQAAWEGDSRRTYGPRPEGSHVLLRPLRDDRVDLAADLGTGERYVIGEGLETVLAAQLAVGGAGVVCVDAGHVANLLRCSQIRDGLAETGGHLVVVADRDESDTGQRAAADCAAMARAAGIPVLVLLPPARYGEQADWNDVLQRDGIEGAEAAARGAAQDARREALEALALAALTGDPDGAGNAVTPLPGLRRIPGQPDTTPPAHDPEAAAAALEAARAALPGTLQAALETPGTRRLVAPATGTGKSHAAAQATAATLGATLLVGATRAATGELAGWSGATVYPARSADPASPGYCARYDEVVEPLAAQRRGIAPLACSTCPLGQAAMEAIAAWPADRSLAPVCPQTLAVQRICSYIWHVEVARRAEHAAATAAKLAGDPDGVSAHRGRRWERDARAMVVDDCPEVASEETATIADVWAWTRTAARQATIDGAADQRATDAVSRTHARRAEGLRALQPQLQRLGEWLAAHATADEQVRLDPAEWAGLTDAALAPAIQWIDATGAEAVLRGPDGSQEIPLRAVQSLCRAIRRGTAWTHHGMLLWQSPTVVAQLLIDGHPGAVVSLDATPSPPMGRLIRTAGGEAGDPEPQPGNLHVVQVYAGLHGKASCADRAPSQGRERDHLLAAIRQEAAALPPGGSMAVLTHMALALRVAADHGLAEEDGEQAGGYVLPPGAVGRDDVTVYLGWWGRHSRGHNAWLECQMLLVWGVQQLSPTAAERAYVGAEAVLRDAGDSDARPVWDPARAHRTYRVPGQPYEIICEGWADDRQDAWARAWTTAEVVQLLGRLRATARPHDTLRAVVYSTYPLAGYGLRVDALDTAAPWRTVAGRRRDEAASEAHRFAEAAAGLEAEGQRVSRRTLGRWLRTRGKQSLRPAVYSRLASLAGLAVGGTVREYSHPRAVPAAWRGGYGLHALTRLPFRWRASHTPASVRGWRVRVLARRCAALGAVTDQEVVRPPAVRAG